MKGHTNRREERRILEIFRAASAAELNAWLAELPLSALIGDLDDRLLGPNHRTAFLALLSKERVGDLGVEARAQLIGALQAGNTDALDERTIRDVLLATTGADLSALKRAINHGGDHRDLQQLIFRDIDDAAIRAELLAHFQREAARAPSGRVKVLSDIDDTFYANWKDTRFPKKTIYPGVRAFYAELGEGELMFLSARPYDRAGFSEGISRATIEAAGVKNATILSGDFVHLIGNESIADKKYENWEQVHLLYPEYGSVFIGDSGQGDAIFGARAAALKGTGLKACFIHDVLALPAPARADFASKRVRIFDTYVGAATAAFELQLISDDGLQRVAEATEIELAEIAFPDVHLKAAREAELAQDLAAMRAALASRRSPSAN